MIATLLADMMVVVLSTDLLYLYYGHWWYDPLELIEAVEVAVLWGFVVAGLSLMVYHI